MPEITPKHGVNNVIFGASPRVWQTEVEVPGKVSARDIGLDVTAAE